MQNKTRFPRAPRPTQISNVTPTTFMLPPALSCALSDRAVKKLNLPETLDSGKTVPSRNPIPGRLYLPESLIWSKPPQMSPS